MWHLAFREGMLSALGEWWYEMPMRVVIVEDEWLIAAALRRQMESYGYLVVGTAGTGTEALELCRKESPDLVLMDVQMPGMDGLEATRILMEEAPTCVVIVTGRGQLDQMATQVGAMSYVVKPLLGSQIPPVIECAQRRFGHYLHVYREVGDAGQALTKWSRVREAVDVLMDRGQTEQQAFQALSEYADRDGKSLCTAAEWVLEKGRSGDDHLAA